MKSETLTYLTCALTFNISFFRSMGTNGWVVTLNVVHWDCSSSPMFAEVANILTDNIFGNSVALVELSYPFSYVPNLPVDMYDLSFGPGTQCSLARRNSGFAPSELTTYSDFL